MFLATSLVFYASLVWALSPSRIIYEFPPPPVKSYIENLAVRETGQLLFTNLSPPLLYLLDVETPQRPPKLLYNFSSVGTTLTGITEAGPNTFFVALQNETLGTFRSAPGSSRLFRIDLQDNTAVVSLLSTIHSAAFINGMITLPDQRTILAADSTNGTVVAIDSHTGNNAIALHDELFTPRGPFPLGINGIELLGEYLYFTSSARDIFGRMPISLYRSDCSTDWSESSYPGPAATISSDGPAVELAIAPPHVTYDDFAIGANGAFLATQSGDRILYARPPARQMIGDTNETSAWIQSDFAGSNSTQDIDEPVSARFGRGRAFDTLYVATGGGSGLQAPLAGQSTPPPVIGAQIIGIKVPLQDL